MILTKISLIEGISRFCYTKQKPTEEGEYRHEDMVQTF